MTKLLVIDTGADTNADEVYQVLPHLPVEVTICHHHSDYTPNGELQRLEYRAEQLGVPLYTTQYLPELLTETQPERVLILMASNEVKDYVIDLMRDLAEYRSEPRHPIKIMVSNPPEITSLASTIELAAKAQREKIDIWIKAQKRYAMGIQELYSRASVLAPLTQMLSSIITGVHYTGGIAELMQLVWQQTDILCSIVAAAENKNRPKFVSIPVAISAEHSTLYRDSLSAVVSFKDGDIVSCISATNGDTGNLGYREELRATGLGGTLELNESLRECRYLNLDADAEYPAISADELMNLIEREILATEQSSEDSTDAQETEGTECLERLLRDFIHTDASKHAPTLRACLPGIWTANAILRSLESQSRIHHAHNEINTLQHLFTETVLVERDIEKLALSGDIETAIEIYIERLNSTAQTNTQRRMLPRYGDYGQVLRSFEGV